jgi:uncharacterized protein YcgI (DUF1989 family)
MRHEVPGGAAWSLRVRHGREVRFTARAAGANASLLLLAAGHAVDRLNVPDTLKAQRSACVRTPMVLMSDRGLGLASVTGSSLDWHDALCGHSTDKHVRAFGPSTYQQNGNDRRLSARTGLLSELRKHGRGQADLHACVNLFSKAAIGVDGGLSLAEDHCAEGDWIALRAEVDLLVVLSTAPHPLASRWSPAAVAVAVTEAAPNDAPRAFTAESARALDQSALVNA